MATCGIIAEYNPFHNGHAYQIRQARKKSNADTILVLMSGDFVQRGAPAVMDKYERARCAIAAGADLVCMLPVSASTGSAELFSTAAILGLKSSGIVDCISFGCEDPVITSEPFQNLAKELACESPAFHQALDKGLRQGLSYAGARMQAIQRCYGASLDPSQLSILEKPNNLLAFSYMQAMRSVGFCVPLYPIRRQGMHYHDTTAPAKPSPASASACRKLLLSGQPEESAQLKNLVSLSDFQSLCDYAKNYAFLSEDDCSSELLYALELSHSQGYTRYLDCSPELSNRLQNLLPQFESFQQFAMLLKNKSLSYSRICRVLIHILLQIETSQVKDLTTNALPYLRVLAMSEKGRSLLGQIRRNGSSPLLTRLSEADTLPLSAQPFISQDLFASRIYRSLLSMKNHSHLPSDFARRL